MVPMYIHFRGIGNSTKSKREFFVFFWKYPYAEKNPYPCFSQKFLFIAGAFSQIPLSSLLSRIDVTLRWISVINQCLSSRVSIWFRFRLCKSSRCRFLSIVSISFCRWNLSKKCSLFAFLLLKFDAWSELGIGLSGFEDLVGKRMIFLYLY